jgi:hypothetical protein
MSAFLWIHFGANDTVIHHSGISMRAINHCLSHLIYGDTPSMQQPSPRLETICRGARIEIRILDQSISLWLNGLKRDEAPLAAIGKLSTSVQTGYEWHEFIEVRFQAADGNLNVVALMNQERILESTFPFALG